MARKRSGFVAVILLLTILLVGIYYFLLNKKERKTNSVALPANALDGGGAGGGNSCPTGEKKYNLQDNYPVLIKNISLDSWKAEVDNISQQIDNQGWFNKLPGWSAKDLNITIDNGYIEKIDTGYYSSGHTTSTEAQLRPILMAFLGKDKDLLGNPDISQVKFVEDKTNKVYSFIFPAQKIGKYEVKDSLIEIRFVDNGITLVQGHWLNIDLSVFSTLTIIPKDKLLNNFSYSEIFNYDGTVPVANKLITHLDKQKFTIGQLIVIGSNICSNSAKTKEYNKPLYLVYEVETNAKNQYSIDTWKLYIDATNGKVVEVR